MLHTDIFSVRNKNIVITGASSGLGERFAELLSEAGANLAICARRETRLKVLEKRLPGRVHAIPLDLDDEASIDAASKAILDVFPTVDVLINNAGINSFKTVLNTDRLDWQKVMNVNVNGTWYLTQNLVREMITNEHGANIINISSTNAERALTPGRCPVYSASKAALNQMTRMLALDLAQYKIRVNAISPGIFRTEMTTEAVFEDIGKGYLRAIPMRRFADANELDGAILFLCSNTSSYMTGAVIDIDGGMTVGNIVA